MLQMKSVKVKHQWRMDGRSSEWECVGDNPHSQHTFLLAMLTVRDRDVLE